MISIKQLFSKKLFTISRLGGTIPACPIEFASQAVSPFIGGVGAKVRKSTCGSLSLGLTSVELILDLM